MRLWTNKEIEFLKEHYGKTNFRLICQRLKRSEKAVRMQAYRLGLTEKVLHGSTLKFPE
jgi:hypothetical protein